MQIRICTWSWHRVYRQLVEHILHAVWSLTPTGGSSMRDRNCDQSEQARHGRLWFSDHSEINDIATCIAVNRNKSRGLFSIHGESPSSPLRNVQAWRHDGNRSKSLQVYSTSLNNRQSNLKCTRLDNHCTRQHFFSSPLLDSGPMPANN